MAKQGEAFGMFLIIYGESGIEIDVNKLRVNDFVVSKMDVV